MNKLRQRFPRIGMRIIKSSLAVGICSLIYYYVLGHEDIPFFFVIAAMQCMQPYQRDIREEAQRNILGTLIGASCGFVMIMLQYFVLAPYQLDFTWYCLLVTLGVAVTLYTSVVLNFGDLANFACVVFLCMIRIHISDEGPFIYVFQRLVETFLGIAVGTVINAVHLPRRKTVDTLFVASLDEILHSEISHLSDYSRVELNRILDEGIPLSVMTGYSAASFHDAAHDLRLKLPVILLDGAVLYDPLERHYLAKADLGRETALKLAEKLEELGLNVFKTVIADDSMLIFYDRIANDSVRSMYERMKSSPLRNYIQMPVPENMSILYIHAIGSTEKINSAYTRLAAEGLEKEYKIHIYPSHHTPGYSYIRIFSKEAERRTMVEKLREISGLSKVKTFGGNENQYDVFVPSGEGEGIIKTLKKEFEPLLWIRKK